LRRDIITHFIEYILRQPLLVSPDSFDDTEHSISLIPTLLNNEDKSTRVENLSQIFSFLSSRLFPLLPSSVSSSFPQSLFKPMTTALLNVLLIPSLPSSFGLLAPFIELAKRSVALEADLATRLESNSTAELPVRTWVDGLAVHYEKQRRLELLGHCRTIILSQEDSKDHFTFEIEVHPESAETNVFVQSDMIKDAVDNSVNGLGFDKGIQRSTRASGEKPQVEEPPPLQRGEIDYQDDAWGFDSQELPEMPEQPLAGLEKSTRIPTNITSEDGDIGWEFDEDDDIPAESSQPDETAAPWTDEGEVQGEPDSDEAWGWNDDVGPMGGESNWDDDPWADASTVQEDVIENHVAPKTASRLEKLANKAKKPVNGLPESAPSISHRPLSNRQNVNGTQHHPEDTWRKSAVPAKHPIEPSRDIIIKERFTVSNKAKRIVKAVQNLIEECKQLQASSLFPLYPQTASSSSNQPGGILSQTSVSFVDLYIALYSVRFDKDLSQSAQKGMLLANSCLYLAHQVEGIGRSLGRSGGFDGLKERLEECGRNLTILSMSWYEQVVVGSVELLVLSSVDIL